MNLCTVLLLTVCLACVVAGEYVLFPPPSTGRHGVDIKEIEITDKTRTDPYDPNGGPRKLMLSVFFPSMPIEDCRPAAHPYMPDATASLFDEALKELGFSNDSTSMKTLALSTCPSEGQSSCISARTEAMLDPEYPVVLFSHGQGTSRLLSSAQAQAVAAQGYTVVTIDHPYDALIVQYLDESIVLGADFNASSIEGSDEAVRTRVKDVSFIIDQLQSGPLRSLLSLRRKMAINHVAMYGHSFGGATAVLAAYEDPRVIGVLNLDGAPFGFNTTGNDTSPQFDVPQGMETPFLLFNAENHVDYPAYNDLYSSFMGYKKRLALLGAEHLSFTDLPLIADLLQARTPDASEYIGVIDGGRAMDSIAAYVGAFMDMLFKGMDPVLPKSPNIEYPEVTFVQ